jgi:hypothetical protein
MLLLLQLRSAVTTEATSDVTYCCFRDYLLLLVSWRYDSVALWTM